MDVARVRADLIAEQDALDDIVAAIDTPQWELPTPSPRWSIIDQIAHLSYFDRAAATAITDGDEFASMVADLWSVASGGDEAVDDLTLAPYRAVGPGGLLEAWRENRASLAAAAATLGEDTRVAWYGPSMGSKSFLTARLMETWAHGQDVVDALGASRPPTDRLHHIARLGFITRGWAYTNRGLSMPDEPVRLELASPSGGVWHFGPEDAGESVQGDAEDFCLVVTQRRNRADTALVATPLAAEWLRIAQAFAGPPTDGPEPGTRP